MRARFIILLESKIEPSVAKTKKLVGRDTAQKKRLLRGETPHIIS